MKGDRILKQTTDIATVYVGNDFSNLYFCLFQFHAHLFFAHPFKGKLKIKASYMTSGYLS